MYKNRQGLDLAHVFADAYSKITEVYLGIPGVVQAERFYLSQYSDF